MILHRKGRCVTLFRQDCMAPSLTLHLPSKFLEPSDDIARPQQRYWRHQTETSISRVVTVSG